ncbi:MAG: hypothetical protein H0T79_04255, partial [Deltaproteobacteria bacterium]|nr:hypothetical protein [Deltaproteobacteria bacterium]
MWRAIPVLRSVRAACEILGLEPLYVACEGRFVIVVSPDAADAVLATLHAHPLGREAAIIGEITEDHAGTLVLQQALGTRRVVPRSTSVTRPPSTSMARARASCRSSSSSAARCSTRAMRACRSRRSRSPTRSGTGSRSPCGTRQSATTSRTPCRSHSSATRTIACTRSGARTASRPVTRRSHASSIPA